MYSFDSKFPHLGISIFPTMTALAQQYSAINLAQGFPGFAVNPLLIDKVYGYLKAGYNQYSPMPGVLKLREALSQKQQKLYNIYYNPDTEITITGGATEAVFSTISALVNEGDEVICFDPAFDIYEPAVLINKGIIKRLKLKGENFKYDWEEVKESINNRTKLLILNSPHNPTGKILTDQDITAIEEIVSKNNIFILSDEVYEHMVYDGKKHICIASNKELYHKTIIIASLGKVFHCTGWRVGYCMAPEKITREIRKIHQFVTFSANTASQYAFADFLNIEEEYLELNNFFQTKRDFFLQNLKRTRLEPLHTEASYFQLLKYQQVSDKQDVDFAKWLVQYGGVASIPISVFYKDKTDNGIIRFCFAKEEAELKEACDRLALL